ncbi:hypothetical protein J4206_06910 [Candidatus Woesearchaeota archaeon]|nr:hypothetical protein [Candidatus Woesearchaeota archaeon]
MSIDITLWGVRGSYAKPYDQKDLQEKNIDLIQAIRNTPTAYALFQQNAPVEEVLKAIDSKRTHTYGGHTSCYEMIVNERKLIFDVGLGGIKWGDYEIANGANGKTKPITADILMTHTHLDHNEAAGFIKPWFQKGHKFTILGIANANETVREAQRDYQDAKSGTATIVQSKGQEKIEAIRSVRPELAAAIEAIVREATAAGRPTSNTVEEVMIALSDKGLHPITWATRQGFGAEIQTIDLPLHPEGDILYIKDRYDTAGFRVGYQMSNHPDGCLSYRVETDASVGIYMGDGEHGPTLLSSRHPLIQKGVKQDRQPLMDPHFIKFIMGKDEAKKRKVIIADAHWTQKEYDTMPWIHGWGHSSAEQFLFTAAMAAKHAGNMPDNKIHVVLSHHDPNKSDRTLDKIAEELEQHVATKKLNGHPLDHYVTWELAREGRKINI